ncbi:MAG TPA: hypothetical protein VGR89_06740 [Puia sp.]|nr:hypothetical protein [Puia sp.]
MSNRLEQFVRDHREEFDGDEPDAKIWEAIRKDMGLGGDPNKKKPATVARLYRAVWAVAAAVVLLIAGTVWFLNGRPSHITPSVATNDHTNQPVQKKEGTGDAGRGQDSSNSRGSVAVTPDSKAKDEADLLSSENEEMYHYAKLVEIKQKQLKTIEKDEPLLYQKFSMDVSKLDSAYHGLQAQLPKNPNQEQILEAMLQNLQLQMGLLNHQLDIIKQINHSKKTAYEKAYKTT